MHKIIAPILCLCLLWGCSGQGVVQDTEARQRIETLENEVKTLREQGAERDKAIREELSKIRATLESISAVLEVERGRAGLDQGKPRTPLDKELDAKAKSFVDENLDRLMDLTRKMRDKMEKEFDEHLKQSEETPPQGDQI